jgi:hypothetical protein
MAELYFQWQNETLLKTIYPLRLKKLRDFLVYFSELEIWAEYKQKTPAELAADIKAYHEGQARLISEAYQEYAALRDYFLKPDVREAYSALYNPVDEDELKKINQLHGNFVMYLPKILEKGGAGYFVKTQETNWVAHREEIRRLIVAKKRRVDAILPNHPNRPLEIKQLENMEKVVLGMAEAELLKLRGFIKAIEKIEPRKVALIKSQDDARRRKTAIEQKLAVLQTNSQPLVSSYKSLRDDIDRLKNPPDLASSQAWFSPPDVGEQIRARFPQADPLLVNKIKAQRKAMLDEFGNIHTPTIKLGSLRNFRTNWNSAVKTLEREAASLESVPAEQRRPEREARLKQLREVELPLMNDELNRLGDFYGAFEFSIRSKPELDKIIAAKEQEFAQLGARAAALKKEIEAAQAELASINTILATDENRYLTEYVPSSTVTAKNIAMLKVEQLEKSLEGKTHYELLEEIVQRFIQNPERYPLWLQYMVIHFSGMRYKSAHGSWADPGDFIARWQRFKAEKELAKLTDADIEKRCLEKKGQYSGLSAPKLARAVEKEWQFKRDNNLRGITTGGPKTRRASLAALVGDEVQYDFLQMTEKEALDSLVAMKDQFPGWLWKELLMLTNLKVNLVNDPAWEKLTPAEEAEKNSYANSDLRMMVNKWKQDYITGWREEHERHHRLIVTRAVCNETAEHCQHMRGHNPPGGLTAKAPWYLKHETENKLPGNPRPYFKKPRKMEDFTPGASILWLRFAQGGEINPWQVARPLTTKEGDTLIAADLMRRGGGASATGNWTYQQGDIITRKRTYLDASKNKVNQEQWLRWIHEATVAATGETAEGTVLLTYETALPDDDPSLSAIGVFKHSQQFALSDGTEDNYNRSFVGFVPEGQLPVEHLEEMLDWNKILLREVFPPAELEAWRKKYIRRQV